MTVPAGTLFIAATGDFMQNGLPDGVALIDTATATVLDALSYEGSITAAIITGFGSSTTLVEGPAFAGADSNTMTFSLARLPNGQDANTASTDWSLTTTLTPGVANVP